MTALRRRLLEDMQVRQLSPHTLPTAARSSGNARSTAYVSGGARHHVPFGERVRPEETMVGGPEQMAADPEEILHDAVD